MFAKFIWKKKKVCVPQHHKGLRVRRRLNIMGKSALEIRVLLDEEQTKMFNQIKHKLGLKSNAETARAIFKREYDRLKAERKI